MSGKGAFFSGGPALPARRGAEPAWWRRLLGWQEAGDGRALAFPPDFLRALERLRLLALRAGGVLRPGGRLGAHRGGQLEFREHRGYAAGDDLRYLDWNLYARLDKPYVKEFAREEAGRVFLLLDATASMNLGRPTKWTFARRLAALLAHAGWGGEDWVRTSIFREAGAPPAVYPARASRPGTAEYLEWLGREAAARRPAEAAPELTGGGALRAALKSFLDARAGRGRVFLISDFWYEDEEVAETVRALAACGCEPCGVQVLAEEEEAPEPGAALRIGALEEQGEVELDFTPRAAAAYREALTARGEWLAELFPRHGGRFLRFSSSTPLEETVFALLCRNRWLG